MIATLRGPLLAREDGACIVEAGGVGYLVQVSDHTASRLPAIGAEARLRTRQIVREDALMLFGFADPDELRLFDLLIGVSGVGPRMALAALSGLTPAALAEAVRGEDVARLVAIPGIGRKTAERLIIELRDKLEFLPLVRAGAPLAARGRRPRVQDARFDDAVAALVTLGYAPAMAQEAARTAVRDAADEESLEAVVKRALRTLARPMPASR